MPRDLSAASQIDLSNVEAALTRIRANHSHSPARPEDVGDVEARAKDLAKKCWQEDEEFRAKEKIAEWLGGQ